MTFEEHMKNCLTPDQLAALPVDDLMDFVDDALIQGDLDTLSHVLAWRPVTLQPHSKPIVNALCILMLTKLRYDELSKEYDGFYNHVRDVFESSAEHTAAVLRGLEPKEPLC